MRAKIGDVVIDRTYNKRGNLAIVVGEGISQPILIDHKGGITMDKLRDYFAAWDELEVIGHIDLERIWEETVQIADLKTENSSEIPNNCKAKNYCDDCLYTDTCDSKEFFYACTSKATISKMEQVETMSCQECKHFHENAVMYLDQCDYCFKDCKYEPKDEPQTEREGER